jgi:serine protease Do
MQEPNVMRPKLRNAVTAALLATTIVGGATAYAVVPEPAAVPAPATQAPSTATMRAAGFADLVQQVRPAVVNISVTEKARKLAAEEIPEPFRRFFQGFPQQRGPRHGLGSGFIIDPEGWIVTNNHVVDGAEKVIVTLEDGTELPATVKGRDPKTDVALIKVEAPQPLAYVRWGESDAARVGDWVVAVGNPFGLGGSVSAGIISARGRDINEGPYDDFIQIDAPINPGNSGGPLFDQLGRVIGISTAIYSPNGGSVGIGFAVPSAIAQKVVAQLKEEGKVERGWLGVQLQPLTPALAKAMGRESVAGALVAGVTPDSPAAKAGLQQGDVVTAAGGKPVKTPRDLARMVGDAKPGNTLALAVARSGSDKTLEAKLGSQPNEALAENVPPADAQEGPKLGLALAPLTPSARAQLGLDSAVKGALIAGIEPGSPAAESGLRPGDVILRVGGDAVDGPGTAVAKLRAARNQKKEAVPLLVMREGTPYYLALELKQA